MSQILRLYGERREFVAELLLQHLRISATAIVIAAAAGLLLGVYISGHRRAAPFVIGVTNVVYTIPSISLLGFLIPFSGIGDTTAIIALTVYALLPMVRNTYTGITSIDPEIIEAARGMGSTDLQIMTRVKLPLAMTVIVAGLRNMVVMTVSLSGIAAFIGAGGLGVAVYRGITTNNISLTVAGSLLIAAVALLCDFLLGRLEHYLKKKWRLEP